MEWEQVGPALGPAPITISGAAFHPLSQDELTVLTGYRLVRAQGGGSMIVEFQDWRVVKWDVRPNFGNAKVLQELFEVAQKR